MVFLPTTTKDGLGRQPCLTDSSPVGMRGPARETLESHSHSQYGHSLYNLSNVLGSCHPTKQQAWLDFCEKMRRWEGWSMYSSCGGGVVKGIWHPRTQGWRGGGPAEVKRGLQRTPGEPWLPHLTYWSNHYISHLHHESHHEFWSNKYFPSLKQWDLAFLVYSLPRGLPRWHKC